MQALVVDDDETSIVVVENILLQMGYEVRVAHNGREALEMIRRQPAHLVITDWEMPEMSGIELCQQIRRQSSMGYVYIIMITGHEGDQQKVEGLMAGADNFLTKPLKPAELLVCLKTAERILSLETCELAIFALAKLAESRDFETGTHVERVQRYARLLAEQLATTEKYKGLIDEDYIRLIHQTTPLHDIGKVGIPDAILLKPGKLDADEMKIMQTHAELGAKTLDAALERFPNARFLQMARNIAATHHEKYDGSGYPHGLAGDQIPLCGRIVALADVYDALTSRRVYKPAIPHQQARAIILRESGGHFDPDIVAAFVAREAGFVEIMESLADHVNDVTPPMVKNLQTARGTKDGSTGENTVLLVEDDPVQRSSIRSTLEEHGFHVLATPNAEQALAAFEKERPRLVVCDWELPDFNGTELCRRVRAEKPDEYIFFLMVTIHAEKDRMIAAFDAGVDDFLIKPLHQGELLARLRAGVRTIRLHDELNRRNLAFQHLNSELMRLNTRLEKLAVTDELTGLYNRRQALIRLQEKCALAERYGDPLSVAMLDLDHFKVINDEHGHDAGDEVLRGLAAVLEAHVRATDTVCRVGGEEFLIIFPAQTTQEAAISAERCRAAVAAHPFQAGEAEIPVTISMGIATYRTGHSDPSTLLKEADIALYAAKRGGRNRVCLSPETVGTFAALGAQL